VGAGEGRSQESCGPASLSPAAVCGALDQLLRCAVLSKLGFVSWHQMQRQRQSAREARTDARVRTPGV
jgi:hypothetical protein